MSDNSRNRLISILKVAIICVIAMMIYKAAAFVYLIVTGGKSKGETSATKYDFAMGTSVSTTIYAEKGVSAEDVSLELIQQIKDLDEDIISWRESDSELSKVNESLSDGESVEMSDELYEAVKSSYDICKDSEGALDITLRPLLECWGIEDATEETFSVPSDETIKDALDKTGYEKLEIDGNAISSSDAVMLDLGSSGKGYALDIARKYLEKNDIKGAMVAVGGSILVYGSKSDGSDWKVGIRDPEGSETDMVGYVTIAANENMCVSTSGDYEKYIEYDGKRYHHIMDRTTGYPADSGLSSVTIVCKSGVDSDGLSTACFVLGKDKSQALLEKYDAEAIFIDQDGNITTTDGLKESFVEQ